MTVHNQQIKTRSEARSKAQKSSGISQGKVGAAIALSMVILLGAFLRFYELGKYSVGNAYYAATVQSMLTSWHNFFFAAFEPGGSITVDKPPLGFWAQAASAYLFGVNGFALALPNALAGVLSIPLLYSMVKRKFGVGAGLIVALVLAVTPVTVSTERNNTIDGLLVFVLMLATWAFIESLRKGKVRYLLLGTFLIGLGFNIKMLQATMPLPALYVFYLLGSPHKWWQRLYHLAIASVVLLVVSLSWAVIVDSTPAEERPFIGSSTNNSVMELIIGHNGLSRLGLKHLLASDGLSHDDNVAAFGLLPNAGNSNAPPANSLLPPGGASQRRIPGNQPGQGRGGNNWEIGEASLARLLSEPLVTEAGWLLSLALLGIVLALVQLGWAWPLSEKHLGVILWSGWLLPEIAYFTFTTSLFHAYYLIMLGPPLAALVGITAWALWRTLRQRVWLGCTLAFLLTGITLFFQIFVLGEYVEYGLWVAAAAVATWLVGLGLLAIAVSLSWMPSARLGKIALGLMCLSLILAPLAWSGLTTFNAEANVWLPRSGPNMQQQGPTPHENTALSLSQQLISDYLLANTDPDDYLVATVNARQASPYILASQRPVLTLGGFTGMDEAVDAISLAQMVAEGELRFVLGDPGLARQKPEIASWLKQQCMPVEIPGVTRDGSQSPQAFVPSSRDLPAILLDCSSYTRREALTLP